MCMITFKEDPKLNCFIEEIMTRQLFTVCLYFAVQPLVVSVGDNKIIQLPEDSLTLSAFTISQDQGRNTQYI